MTRRTSPAEAGFTLAETLVALFVLALVSASGTALLMGATESGQQIRAAEAQARQLDIAQALIRQDIAAMSPRANLPESGYGEAGNLFGAQPRGATPFLSFIRDGWINPGGLAARSDLQYVRYRLEDGVLIRDAASRADPTRATAVSSRALFEDIAQLDIQFWRGGQSSLYWDGNAGQPLHILPDLIEIDIQFESGQSLSLAALTGGRI